MLLPDLLFSISVKYMLSQKLFISFIKNGAKNPTIIISFTDFLK
jgi:hypothetical protein